MQISFLISQAETPRFYKLIVSVIFQRKLSLYFFSFFYPVCKLSQLQMNPMSIILLFQDAHFHLLFQIYFSFSLLRSSSFPFLNQKPETKIFNYIFYFTLQLLLFIFSVPEDQPFKTCKKYFEFFTKFCICLTFRLFNSNQRLNFLTKEGVLKLKLSNSLNMNNFIFFNLQANLMIHHKCTDITFKNILKKVLQFILCFLKNDLYFLKNYQ
jgi:hypothetical protein